MNRAYALLASLILIATPMAGCLSGEDLEELVDDVLGCMDENAANYEENATAELVGDCIYMATTETFIEAMTDMGSIEDMLEESPKAGYSQSISSSEWNQDLGMQMDVEIEDIVQGQLYLLRILSIMLIAPSNSLAHLASLKQPDKPSVDR